MIVHFEFFLLGILLGAAGVGLPTLRTIQAMEGHYKRVFFVSLLASVSMFIYMYLAVTLNYYFMVGNALGAAASVSYIGYKRSKR